MDGDRRAGGDEAFRASASGILVPGRPVTHRPDAYDEWGFELLLAMQTRHFWFRGRHRYLYRAFRAAAARLSRRDLSAVDLGGGCGGWVRYLAARGPGPVRELALADSSLRALQLADGVVPPEVTRYQVDLLDLPWRQRWDVAFLLDTLEHIEDDTRVLGEIRGALRPGGLLFVTTPAFPALWSYNDEVAGHRRRYTKRTIRALAAGAGLDLVHASYFMFLLSPLLAASRLGRTPRARSLTRDEMRALVRRTHRVPPAAVNETLAAIFAVETALARWVPFPGGTSLLGIFRNAGDGSLA
jgi:SAM-dependent methyltransferase